MVNRRFDYKDVTDDFLRSHEGWQRVEAIATTLPEGKPMKSLLRSIRTRIDSGDLIASSDSETGKSMRVMLPEMAELESSLAASSLEFEYSLCVYLESVESVLSEAMKELKNLKPSSFGVKMAEVSGGAFLEAARVRCPALALMKNPTVEAWKAIPPERLPPSVNAHFENMEAAQIAAALAKVEALENVDFTSDEKAARVAFEVEQTRIAERKADNERRRLEAIEQFESWGIEYDAG